MTVDQITSYNVRRQDYPGQDILTVSSASGHVSQFQALGNLLVWEEGEIVVLVAEQEQKGSFGEFAGYAGRLGTRGRIFSVPWGRLIQADPSSKYPLIRFLRETTLIEEFFSEVMTEETLHYDVWVPMPPRRRYSIFLEIENVRRAVPNVIEPLGH